MIVSLSLFCLELPDGSDVAFDGWEAIRPEGLASESTYYPIRSREWSHAEQEADALMRRVKL